MARRRDYYITPALVIKKNSPLKSSRKTGSRVRFSSENWLLVLVRFSLGKPTSEQIFPYERNPTSSSVFGGEILHLHPFNEWNLPLASSHFLIEIPLCVSFDILCIYCCIDTAIHLHHHVHFYQLCEKTSLVYFQQDYSRHQIDKVYVLVPVKTKFPSLNSVQSTVALIFKNVSSTTNLIVYIIRLAHALWLLSIDYETCYTEIHKFKLE